MKIEKIKGDKHCALIDKNKNILGEIIHIPENNELISCYADERGEQMIIGISKSDVIEKIKLIAN